jgi:hypothetical protein
MTLKLEYAALGLGAILLFAGCAWLFFKYIGEIAYVIA